MLDLAPDVESAVQNAAAREGISVNELIARRFSLRKSTTLLNGGATPVSADDPVLAFLNARIAEADAATPEEVAAADAAFRQWQQNMDAPRRANGERLLFPDVDKS